MFDRRFHVEDAREREGEEREGGRWTACDLNITALQAASRALCFARAVFSGGLVREGSHVQVGALVTWAHVANHLFRATIAITVPARLPFF